MTAAISAMPGVSRVTVVGPAARVDLAIPDDVPLANLMPTLLRYVGEYLADDGVTHGGWVLSRLGGRVVDSARTAAQSDIRDGELLYLTPFGDGGGDLVFDDIADAVATATENRPGRWRVEHTRRFALWSAAAALLAGAFALLLVGSQTMVAGLVSLGVGLALIVVAAVLSRAFGERRSSGVLALVALPYALVGGALIFAGHRTAGALGAPHVLIGASLFIVYSAIATLAIGRASGLFVGAGGAGLALGVSAAVSLVFGARPAASAAIVAAVAFALIPVMPMLAYRLARAPVPAVPRGPEDLKSNPDTVDGARVRALADRADDILTGLLGTVAIVLLGAEVVLAVDARVPSLALCGLLAVLVLLRARPYSGWRQRLPLLIVGSLGLGLSAVSAFMVGGSTTRLVALPVGLLVVATLTLVYGLVVAGRRISPVWPRTLDVIEIILIVVLVPMTAWVAGAFGWIRAIHG